MATFQNSEQGEQMITAISKFAWDLYRELSSKDANANLFISPASISMALAMTYLGADGNTKEEMKKAMNLEKIDEDQVHPAFEDIAASLVSTDGHFELKMANRLYANEGFQIIQAFHDAVKKHYKADMQVLKFGSDPQGSADTINQWVEDQTNNKIKDLIQASVITPLTRLILVNAVYFKGNWASQFKIEATSERDFYISSDETIKVPMMSQQGRFNFGYSQELETQVLEMPYIEEKLSMVILLPRSRDGLAQLQSKLVIEHLTDLPGQFRMHQTNVLVQIPKYRLEDSYDLEAVLPSIGIKELFSEGCANLSRIDASNNLYVSKVVHKTYIEVNEEGSEAAAATGVVAMARSMPPRFVCDHPFIFFIRDNATGAIIFLGHLTKPAAAPQFPMQQVIME